MDTFTKILGTFILFFVLFTATLSANVHQGEKIYLKYFKHTCGFSSIQFAHKHTQDEWEEISEAGQFSKEVVRLCPKAKMNATYSNHLYEFVYEYASDSGNVPNY